MMMGGFWAGFIGQTADSADCLNPYKFPFSFGPSPSFFLFLCYSPSKFFNFNEEHCFLIKNLIWCSLFYSSTKYHVIVFGLKIPYFFLSIKLRLTLLFK